MAEVAVEAVAVARIMGGGVVMAAAADREDTARASVEAAGVEWQAAMVRPRGRNRRQLWWGPCRQLWRALPAVAELVFLAVAP